MQCVVARSESVAAAIQPYAPAGTRAADVLKTDRNTSYTKLKSYS